MKRLVSFLYDRFGGGYKYFGAIARYDGSVCGDIIPYLLLDRKSPPHYFDIWVGDKNPKFKLERRVNSKLEEVKAYYEGINQTLYKKVETTTWFLNGTQINLPAMVNLHMIVCSALGDKANVLEFNVYTYGIEQCST